MDMIKWLAFLTCTVLGAATLGGCGSLITAAMVHAPNRGDAVEDDRTPGLCLKFWGIDRELRVPVGPPEASLRLWVIEPAGKNPTGTILLLHGYRASMMWLRGMGKEFAEEGYRVVMVDQRGHGRSSGQYITYGVVESRDARQVIDFLESNGLIAGKLGVWGISMGGATAVQLAAADARVSAVVAVATFTSMRDSIRHGLRLIPVYGWLLDEEGVNRQLERGGARAQFDVNDADVLRAIEKVKIPVRLIHGKCDWIVPPSHGRALQQAAAGECDLVELPWTGHISAHFSGAVERASVEWFDRHVASTLQAQDPGE
jgi:pimeloyl-ACP methyl ester carboxylesterase